MKDLETLVLHRHLMFEELWQPNKRQHSVGDRAYRKWVTSMMRAKRYAGFLAETEDGYIVGSGCVWLREVHPFPGSPTTHAPYVLSMFTERNYRGKGVATMIITEAKKWSQKKGFKIISLHASQLGRSVYRKNGFERTWEMRVRLANKGSH